MGADGEPRWRQIAADLRRRIGGGEWPPGAVLPSQQRLAVEYGVGSDAARDALLLLRSYGLIRMSQGYRARVREQPRREVIRVGPGAVVLARPPTAGEQLPPDQGGLGLDDGVWVLLVDGVAYAADAVEVLSEAPDTAG